MPTSRGNSTARGGVWFRRIDTSDDSISIAPVGGDVTNQLRQNAPLARSSDYSTLFWQETDVSGGPIALYDATTDAVVSRRQTMEYLGNASAVSRDGRLVAMYLSGQLTIMDRQLNNVRTLDGSTAGFGFDPQRDLFYAVDSDTDQVIAYGTTTWQEKYRLDLGQNIDGANGPFGEGAMAFSHDGTTLYVSTSYGIRVLSLPQPDGRAKTGVISGFPSYIRTGVQGSFTLQFMDGAGGPATSFRGTVHFTSSDPSALLPADYTFTAADQGSHTFATTLSSVGTQTISATVVGTALTAVSDGITVHAPGTPLVPISGQRDVIFDASRGELYILTMDGYPDALRPGQRDAIDAMGCGDRPWGRGYHT